MKIGRRGYVLVLVLLDEGQTLLLGGQYGSLPGIYPRNFHVRQTAQETQSFNWVFKFNLHKIFFLSILTLTLHSKQISLLSFFCFKLFICPPDVKRPVFSGTFLSELLPGFCHEQVVELSTFYNIRKLNLFSKMDNSKTAWINACLLLKICVLTTMNLI